MNETGTVRGEGVADTQVVALRPLQQVEAAAGHRQMRRRSTPGAARLPDPPHAEAHLGHGARPALDQALQVQ